MAKSQAQSSTSGIADSLYATGNYAKAINQYAKEDSRNGSLQIARAYNAIGNYEKAIVQYQSVVAQNPDFQIAGFELGKLLVKTKAYDEARKLFSKLVSTNKENPEYFFYLGEAFRALDQPASSLTAYKSTVEKDSTHLRSLFRLGTYFVAKQEKVEALHYIEMGLRFYPEDIALINLKALVLFNDAAYEKAIPWFEKVLELGEIKEYIYEKLAYCYYKNWDFEKAREAYRILLGINDQNSATYFSLAAVHQKEKQLDSAEIYVKKGMDVQRPVFSEGYGRLASLARERNDLQAALNYYKLAYQEDVSDFRVYYQICTISDQLYKDPKMKLDLYQGFIAKFGINKRYFSETVSKRISELKEEIHFASE